MRRESNAAQLWDKLFASRLAHGHKHACNALSHMDMRHYIKEDCKYTDLSLLGNAPYQKAEITDPSRALYEKIACDLPSSLKQMPRLVFLNGYLCPRLSSTLQAPLHIGVSDRGDKPVDNTEDGFYLLNCALGETSVELEVRGADDVANLLILSIGCGGETPVSFHPCIDVDLAEKAKLNLFSLNLGEGTYFHNGLVNINLQKDAYMEHVTVQRDSLSAINISPLRVHAHQNASYRGYVMGLGGKLARYERRGILHDKDAEIQLNGMQYLRGNSVGEMTGGVAHLAPCCVSRQFIRNVADGHARGIFQGRVYVSRDAYQTDGSQLSQNLLLSDKAQIDTKPELEIYAEDVSCNHGATIGELDEEALFYLQSRGIPQDMARAMLIEAFLRESLLNISDAQMHDLCRDMLRQSHDEKDV